MEETMTVNPNQRFFPLLTWLGILALVAIMSCAGAWVIETPAFLNLENHLTENVLRKEAKTKFYENRWGYNFSGPYIDSWDQLAFNILPKFDAEKTDAVILGSSIAQQSWLPDQENSSKVANLACGNMTPVEILSLLEYLRDEKKFFAGKRKTVIIGTTRGMALQSANKPGQLTKTLQHAWTFEVINGKLSDVQPLLKETRLHCYRLRTLSGQLAEYFGYRVIKNRLVRTADEREASKQKLPKAKTQADVSQDEIDKLKKRFEAKTILYEIINLCQKNNVRLIFISFPKLSSTRFDADTIAFNQTIESFCRDTRVEFVDFGGLLPDQDFYDHLSHPLYRGRVIIHRELSKLIYNQKAELPKE
jgi:hypothetical protein